MASELNFVVRRLESSNGKSSTATLDGAFRVHIPPDCLGKGLNIGDLCEISDVNALGYGIAWRATERLGNSPKDKPASMTPMLRAAFGIKEGSLVNLKNTSTKILHADKVILTDVTAPVYATDSDNEQPKTKWRHRCAVALNDCEAFAENVTFDISWKKHRKRFSIEQITSSEARGDVPNLFYCDDYTEVVIVEARPSFEDSDISEDIPDPISEHRIGGLINQIQELNRRMKRVLGHAKKSKRIINEGILIHGYEGTGKSLLLSQMESRRFREVIRLNRETLDGGSSAKNKSIIESKFQQALKRQPSLILMDDVEELAPVSEGLYTKTIVAEIDKIFGSRVLVAAACRSPADLNSALVKPGRLYAHIDLPIPDQQARLQILDSLLDKSQDNTATIARGISHRTHGFTGQDLVGLIQKAESHADNRRQERIDISTTHPTADGPFEVAVDNNWRENGIGEGVDLVSQKYKDDHSDDLSAPSMSDFEMALKNMRPTALREIFFETPNVQWSDIGGSQGIKSRFDRLISWPLLYPEIMKQARKRPKKGVLLYGPPGCSKTLTAQAVASTYGLNFIAVKGAELISMYVGESERAVREIFRRARAAAPCVIFFDEIDSIASERENAGTKGLNVLTTLLNEMDGFESLKGVLILAATNKPEILDPAIMRPGRFDSHVYLGLPNELARKEILDIQTKDMAREHDLLDMNPLVEKTEGYTGAEIVAICDLATDEAVERTVLSSSSALLPLEWQDFEVGLKQTGKKVTAEVLAGYESFAHSRD